ncbi:MAG: hypothetical protein U0P45_13680 [Acidimicrobiales bacterium]
MRRTRTAVVAVALACAVVALSACEPPPRWTKVKVDGYQPVSHTTVESLQADQGPATVHPLSGKPYLVYGGEIIDKSFTDDGWNHVGDPDSLDGFTVYPYQAADAADGKMFHVVTPRNRSFRYVHPLDPGEEMNNSFAAISPDGQWLVAGEWDTQTRLLIFPMPILNHAYPSGGGALPLAGKLALASPLSQVQGCDFVTDTQLVCSVDDATKRLVRLDLPAALDGTDTTATVTTIGKIPTFSSCAPNERGGYEAEGVDFDVETQLLRVQVIPPPFCYVHTDQYTYRRLVPPA